MKLFVELISKGPPRQLQVLGETKIILVFSDGACEGEEFESVSIGAVMFDTADNTREMWGSMVCSEVVDHWRSDKEGKIQTIGQAELCPAVVARYSWQKRMRHRRVLFFLDNDGARQGLIKGRSDSATSNTMIKTMVTMERKFQSWTFYARVPTHSNPGDGPSRLRLTPHPENLLAKQIEPPSPEILSSIGICGKVPEL